MSIRFLDWSEALGPVQTQRLKEVDSVLGQPRDPGGPPGLGSGERFPVVIGSDLLYEVYCHGRVDCLQVCIFELVSRALMTRGSRNSLQVYHADLLAAVLADRLALDGTAYLALSVRRQVSHFDPLHDTCVCRQA